jgi:predicted AAA+ superfamily ATPase
MATTNHQIVDQGLRLLGPGLRPFVERELRAQFKDEWLSQGMGMARGQSIGRGTSPDDPQVLLKLLVDNWRNVFEQKLSRADQSYIHETRDVRNRWAHHESFSTDDALRALDTIHRLLQAVSAGEPAIEVDHLRQGLMRRKFDEQARTTYRTRTGTKASGDDTPSTASGLPGWREIVEPHDDVATGRYELAQFAADLHQVWRGDATSEYGDAAEFFQRTFITEGLGELLVTAVRRFTGAGGDPIIKLQTNFGGGKTHSLIALYHLASGHTATELAGVEQLLTDHQLTLPAGEVRRVVLVGQQLQPSSVDKKSNSISVRTMWGELAWQLGGAEGYALVADADRAGVSPGSALTDLFRRYSPCLVLIDEWVAYARQLYGVDGLPAGSFDAQASFAQALTDAARAVPQALVVATIPSSDIEVGGEGGRLALAKLENIIGRMEATWRTATTEESFEIVRRRLFKDLTANQARQRDAVVKAFGELYRSHTAEFPFECRDADYERRMRAAYPIHPELFDRLFGDWSELERFQRTRGVLRLMAKVIHGLWMSGDPNLVIMPGSIPMDDEQVTSELTRYLDPGWNPVIETDVDGPNSTPFRLDSEHTGTFGKVSAARRVARTVYFGSAPSLHAATKGLDDRHIRLGCVQPGERPPVFGDALRRLADQAMYLYRDGNRYWYGLKTTVTRLAQDRAATDVTDDYVDEEIRRRLDRARQQPGGFTRVHVAPRSPADVPDEDSARLVVLGPERAHDPKIETSDARALAEQILTARGSGNRLFRNMIVFAAPDRAELVNLRDAARQWLAWTSIDRDKVELGLDPHQISQVTTRVNEADRTIDLRIDETWIWILNPNQPREDPTGPIRWAATRAKGACPLAERVTKKLTTEESLIPAYSGARLRLDLDRVPLWRGDHVSVSQLWEDYAQYLYLPRLVSRGVLHDAITTGVALDAWGTDTFAWADEHDTDSDRYLGLVGGTRPTAVVGSGLLVKPEIALRQLTADAQRADPTTNAHPSPGPSGPGPRPTGPGTSTAVVDHAPRHYYGRVTLESARWMRSVSDIAEAIVGQLNRPGGANVRITVEIEADSPDGFDDGLQRTVTENAVVLKFSQSEFVPDP